MRDDRGGRGGRAAAGRLAGVHRLQPRRRAARDALGRRRRAPRAHGADDPADAPRDAVSLLRRRDRACRTSRRTPRPRWTRSRGAPATPPTTATCAGRRCRGRPRRAAGSRRPRRRRGCRSAMAERNVAAQREDPASTLHLVRDLIALRGRDAGPHRWRVREPCAGRRMGLPPRGRLRGRGQPLRRGGRGAAVSRVGSRSRRTAGATARRSAARSSSARGRASSWSSASPTGAARPRAAPP